MTLLTVNMDLTAVLRAVRRLKEPDPAQAAVLAELGGADGIAVQLRRDKKYVRERDLYVLKGVVKTKLVLEMPPVDELVERVLEIKPWMVIISADHADSDSPMSPIDFSNGGIDYGATTSRLAAVGINVGFFIEPEADEVKGASKSGAAAVFINCAGYTEARTIEDAQKEIDRIDRAASSASKANLAVYAGRGVTYKNIGPLVELGNIDEFIIGHAISARAMLVGYQQAVSDMLTTMRNVRTAS